MAGDMRLDHIEYEEGKGVKELLAFYMGKNNPDRQEFIIENLRDDVDKQVAVAWRWLGGGRRQRIDFWLQTPPVGKNGKDDQSIYQSMAA